MSRLTNKRIALVYDRVNKWGGAERVLLALHELFPDAPLYTSVYDSEYAPWASVFDVKTSFLQGVPFAKSHHELLPFFMPLAFETFSFDGYDLVISVTSEAAKGVITKSKTKHICYCLTPTRYLWSGYDDYFRNIGLRFFSAPVVSYLRKWDQIAAQRPDGYIAISKEVQGRIKKYYGKNSELVYPPAELHMGRLKQKKVDGDYFLIVSRLVPYKRIDLAVQACSELHLPLKVIGKGSQERYLRSIAGPTVEFLGSVTDEELAGHYNGCKALIFPGIEDFGITIVEAQSLGKPVIAFKAGGALETIIDHKTGIFFEPQTKNALKTVLQKFEQKSFLGVACKKQAEKFNKSVFKEKFLSALDHFIV